MIEIDDVSPAPWGRSDWTGQFVSVDGTPVSDVAVSDVARIVAWHSSGDEWDGVTAGIAELADGRFISWEAGYGPTGNGFCGDAYGGESDIMFAASVEAARSCLSEWARDALEVAP